MGYLKRDKQGRIYETSPDLQNGGFKGYPTPVDSAKDNTLGASHTRAVNDVTSQQRSTQYQNAVIDQTEFEKSKIYNQRKAQAKRLKAQREELLSRPEYQEQLLRKALTQQDSGNNYKVGLSGYGLTPNGQMGERGLTDNQKAIKDAVFGNATTLAPRISQLEAEQHRLNNIKQARLFEQARLEARRNEWELQQERRAERLNHSKDILPVGANPLMKLFKRPRAK